jgi:hypothetical protein
MPPVVAGPARHERHSSPVGIIGKHLTHGQSRWQGGYLDTAEQRVDYHPGIAARIEKHERDVAMRLVEPTLRQSPPPRAAGLCGTPDQDVVDGRQG